MTNNFNDEIENALNIIGSQLIANVKEELSKYSSLSDSRILNDADSIIYFIEKDKNGRNQLVMQLPNYAIYVDRGRKANGKPVPEKDAQGNYPIREWMKRKGLPRYVQSNYIKKDGTRSTAIIDFEQTIRFVVGVRGIEKRPFLKKSLTKSTKQIIRALEKRSEKVILRRLDRIIKKIR